VYFDSTEVIMD